MEEYFRNAGVKVLKIDFTQKNCKSNSFINQSTDSCWEDSLSNVGWKNDPEWGLNPCPAEPGYTLPLQTV